jgi:hypothetical protein
MPKKPLYTGDPNATMTICVKKLRRHLPSDLSYAIIPPGEGDTQVTVMPFCRHCKQDPMIKTDNTLSGAATDSVDAEPEEA